MVAFAQKLAAENPDEIALRDSQRALSWAELNDVLNRSANSLLAADLGPERRIAVFAENSVETALAHMGGLLGGASSVPSTSTSRPTKSPTSSKIRAHESCLSGPKLQSEASKQRGKPVSKRS